jgi:hypothetical protein|tara:strand:+ start:876 stop:1025 length:150 start_codon:yes stop_codon:yes gene_type:complete
MPASFDKVINSILNDELNKAELLLNSKPEGLELVLSLLKMVKGKLSRAE